jgi:hypothetical protein
MYNLTHLEYITLNFEFVGGLSNILTSTDAWGSYFTS